MLFLSFNNKVSKIAVVLLLGICLWGVANFLRNIINPPLYVIIQFAQLGPIYKKMPVYYKGYKIGVTEKIKPSDDYKTTLVTVRFYPNDLKLPNNTFAKVKPLTTTRDYIELIYPDSPSEKILKTADIIQGSTTIDIKSFMNAQYESGAIGYIIENASLALTSIMLTSNEAKKLISTINLVVSENRKSFSTTAKNISDTSKNISDLSLKLNTAISQESLNTNEKNISDTIENIEKLTKNLNNSVEKFDYTVCQINGISKNINEITSDINHSVKNRKGLAGVLFGTKNTNNPKCANEN